MSFREDGAAEPFGMYPHGLGADFEGTDLDADADIDFEDDPELGVALEDDPEGSLHFRGENVGELIDDDDEEEDQDEEDDDELLHLGEDEVFDFETEED